MIDKNKSNNAVSEYIYFANNCRGYSNNQITLKNQKVNILIDEHYIGNYESDVQINYDIPSDAYYLTFLNDTLCCYLHKSIFWATRYSFKVLNKTLMFRHERKVIEISC